MLLKFYQTFFPWSLTILYVLYVKWQKLLKVTPRFEESSHHCTVKLSLTYADDDDGHGELCTLKRQREEKNQLITKWFHGTTIAELKNAVANADIRKSTKRRHIVTLCRENSPKIESSPTCDSPLRQERLLENPHNSSWVLQMERIPQTSRKKMKISRLHIGVI